MKAFNKTGSKINDNADFRYQVTQISTAWDECYSA